MNKNYKEIEFYAGCDIAEAVNRLLKCKENGILAYGEFNGHMLYSDTVTLNGAYLEILGMTKEDYDKSQQEWREKIEKERKEHEEAIPSLSMDEKR